MDIARKLPTATRGQFRLTGTKVLALFAAFALPPSAGEASRLGAE